MKKIETKKYGLQVSGSSSPMTFSTIKARRNFIRKFMTSTYSTFTQKGDVKKMDAKLEINTEVISKVKIVDEDGKNVGKGEEGCVVTSRNTAGEYLVKFVGGAEAWMKPYQFKLNTNL